MKTAAPRPRAVIVLDAPAAPASRVRRETRNGVLYVVGPDGIAQPVSSERVAVRVEASVRNLGRS